MLTREEAKKRINDIVNRSLPVKTGVKLPIKLGETFNVYKISLDLLVPNLLNDRIAWKIREFEAEHDRKLSFELQGDIEYVFELLEAEHPSENDKTMEDIALKGQQEHGVITNDGIIIDGNRRATLIRKLFNGEARKYNKNIEEFRYFEAIVLNENVSPEEIMALETSLQIGEDIKIGYNRINLYIKVDNLLKAGYNYSQISQYMGKDESELKNMTEVFELMNIYLETIGKRDHYTLLDGLEDHFINAKNIFKKLDSKTYSCDWEYTDYDVTNFKQVAFDYMRAKYEGKKFREILLGKPQRTDGVFIKQDLWNDFYANHEEIVNNSTLDKEEDWKMLTPKIEGNLRRTNKLLKDTLDDKSISSIIDIILTKVTNLEGLITEKNELNDRDITNIQLIEKKLYSIRKEFK